MTWHPAGRTSIVMAVAVGLATTVFRVLSSPGFENDHFMHLAWATQIVHGDIPGRDFVEPGMPLAVALSAAAFWLSPNPLSEELLTSGMMGLAAALTFLVVVRLAGSKAVALGAALFELALLPRLYGYPKILVPALTILALMYYLRRPSHLRLAAPAAATVVAILLRHDLGVFAASAIVMGLGTAVAFNVGAWASRLGVFGALTAALLLPYLLFVQWSEGVVEHLRRGVEFSKGEAHQLWPPFPAFEPRSLADWMATNAPALLVWSVYALFAAALTWLIAGRHRRSREENAVAAAAVTLFGGYIQVILRHPLPSRMPDLAGILAITGGWLVGELVLELRRGWRTSRARTGIATVALAAVLAIVTTATSTMTKLMERLDDSALLLGPEKVGENVRDIVAARTIWPWTPVWPSGNMPAAIEYLARCTAPSDRLLMTWPAPEYYYFTRRQFAAGHALMLPPRAFATDVDRAQMARWLEAEYVPVTLINEERWDEFALAYGNVAAYVRDRYAEAGRFTIYDGATITIAIRKDLRATGTYGDDAWPCNFQSSGDPRQ